VRYLLEQGIDIHRQIKSQTMNWKMLRAAARLVVRSKVFSTKLLRRVAESSGLTALHYAARRGDVEIVELLMEYKANSFIKNDLGRDVLSYCEAFPEIKDAIKRVQREAKRVHHRDEKNRPLYKGDLDFTLQRRLSTATTVKYNMYLINTSTMFKLFADEDDRKKNIKICHQDLLQRGQLTRFEDLPLSSFVIFVSHEWSGFNHPDPNGRHIHVLCKTLRDLRDGVYDKIETEPFSVLSYHQNTTTSASEWGEILSNAYIWFDFWCQPQPTMAKDTNESERLQKELGLAIESMASYVERSDTVMILVPPSVHDDRIDSQTGRKAFTCYRTWRRRGLCVFELFCAFLSRRKTHPVLLVRSGVDRPMWVSPHECLKLAVGKCEFTCCETNHLGHDGETPMSCSRSTVFTLLNHLIDAKIRDLLTRRAVVHSRNDFFLFFTNTYAYTYTHTHTHMVHQV
jgi:hypothetical protein